MHKAHHPKDGVHRLYIRGKEGSRGLVSSEEYVEDAITGLHYYVQNSHNLFHFVNSQESLHLAKLSDISPR